jgi:hypothetical protein
VVEAEFVAPEDVVRSVVKWVGGEVAFTGEEVDYAYKLEQEVLKCERGIFSCVVREGELLAEIYGKRLYLALVGDYYTSQDNFRLRKSPDTAFRVWLSQLNISPPRAYRAIRIYKHLYLPHQELFDEWLETGEKLPSIKRLGFLAGEGRHELETMPELLTAAKDLSGVEWDATTKILIEGLDQDTAHQQAEDTARRAAEVLNKKRRQVKRTWESEAYRIWIATQPCDITGEYEEGQVICAHLGAKGMGGGGNDFCNVVPMLSEVHAFQHQHGWPKFEKQFDVIFEELEAHAVFYTMTYLSILETLTKKV